MNPRLLEAIEGNTPERPPSHYDKVRLRYLDNVATRIAKAAGLRVKWGSNSPPMLRNQAADYRRVDITETPFMPSKARLMAGR